MAWLGQELGAEAIFLAMTVFCSEEAGLFMQNGETILQRRRDDPLTPQVRPQTVPHRRKSGKAPKRHIVLSSFK